MEENFQNPQPIPGYLDVPTIEMVLKYLGEGAYKKQQFSEWQSGFKASWVALTQ
jgi:thioredoxin-related protein